jgi:CheY-like chemotaxis protein
MGDEMKLREVLQNLITNGLEHAAKNGTVLVEGDVLPRPDGPVVKVVVQDDGPGMPEEQMHLAFDRYRHGPGGTASASPSARSSSSCTAGIWAERPADGGCLFFTPARPGRLEGGAELRALGEGSSPGAHRRGQTDIAAVLEGILRKRYRVDVARDGREGVAKAHTLHPDLVVMDVFLPHLDGLDAVLSLKASSDTADIPVILVSAQVGVADRVRALNLGAVDYLAKPFHASELLQRAERALAVNKRRASAPEAEGSWSASRTRDRIARPPRTRGPPHPGGGPGPALRPAPLARGGPTDARPPRAAAHRCSPDA